MYKPNFCTECGERITRARWHFWTSRKFCYQCEPRFRKARILGPIISGTALFALGLLVGNAVRTTPPPLLVERGQRNALPAATVMEAGIQAESAAAEPNGNTTPQPEPKYGPDGTATERPTDPNEVVSICGARTQKGTPCSRRVRGTGRCWQHIGMKASLPLEKRLLTGK